MEIRCSYTGHYIHEDMLSMYDDDRHRVVYYRHRMNISIRCKKHFDLINKIDGVSEISREEYESEMILEE
jgi:hypothetical protein